MAAFCRVLKRIGSMVNPRRTQAFRVLLRTLTAKDLHWIQAIWKNSSLRNESLDSRLWGQCVLQVT